LITTDRAERDVEEVCRNGRVIAVDVLGEAVQERFDGAVGTVSTREHEHIHVENDLHWVPGSCRTSDGECTQLRYVGAVVLRVFQTEFLNEGRAHGLRGRRDMSDGEEPDLRQMPTYPTEGLELLHDRFALPPCKAHPVQIYIDAVPDQDFGTCALASE
jgi:hypothetical protein